MPIERVQRIGPRIVALAVLAGIAPVDPSIFRTVGPFVVLAIWILGAPGRLRIDALFWITATSVAWTYLTTQWAINPIAWQPFYFMASSAIVFILGRDAIRNRRQARIVAYGYLIGLFIGVSRLIAENYGLITGEAQSAAVRLAFGNLNANYVGYSLAGGLAVVVFLWVTTKTIRARAWLAITAGAIILGFVLTDTRGAVVGAILLAIWLLLTRALKRPPLKFLVTVVGIFAVLIATGVADTMLRAFDFGARATGDLSGRLLIWPQARDIWDESWFIGSGPWAMRYQSSLHIDAHNILLEVGSSQGIVGVILTVLLLITALWWANRDAETRFRRLVIGSFVAAMAPAYLTGAWENTASAWILLMIMSRIAVPSAAEVLADGTAKRPATRTLDDS